jgi:NTP pyrophosphatase (non-canonical NTP hydrolase)
MSLTFQEFSAKNRERSESDLGFNHKLESWTLAEWFMAVTGELGEAANIGKKIRRCEQGLPGNGPSEELVQLKIRLAEELADTFTYLDLLASSQGFVLEEIVKWKFNMTSAKIGCPIVFPNPTTVVAEKPTLAEVQKFIEKQREELNAFGKRIEDDQDKLQHLHSHVAFYTDELPPLNDKA